MVATWARKLHRAILEDPENQNSRDDLAELASLVTNHRATSSDRYWEQSLDNKDDDLLAIIEALLTCENYTLLDRAIGELKVEYGDISSYSLPSPFARIDLQKIKTG